MTLALLSGHGTLDQLLGSYGYAAVLAFVAVESLGVPFPGETRLIAAALYAGPMHQLQSYIARGVLGAIVVVGFLVFLRRQRDAP